VDKPTNGQASGVPPGAPAWVTADLIAETIRVWQPGYNEPITADEALGILLRVGQLFSDVNSVSKEEYP
jgi:hypothetical protein